MLLPLSATYNNTDELFQEAQRFTISQDKTNHKQRTTQLIDYPFELYVARCNESWHLEIRNATHNHDHSNNIAGSRPREIIFTLYQNHLKILVTNVDIYNTCTWLWLKNLAGHTPIRALVDKLQNGDFLYEYKCDNTDCSYKTNRFKMQLLNVIGITALIPPFILMQKPDIIVTNRELAFMNALGAIFSDSKNLLCVWHISKNILKNYKPQFSQK
ncbi:14939_t:CDS:2 [Cetraspora pellucida]|uniref:14939_t:CDS:1 n=1 Tax=Cetraspora pellucida TaxID=1433469 RepID=A0A9N9DPJ9_9GLOM|nr:14939_t:CDS:2 [Cetraspora pellucida]